MNWGDLEVEYTPELTIYIHQFFHSPGGNILADRD